MSRMVEPELSGDFGELDTGKKLGRAVEVLDSKVPLDNLESLHEDSKTKPAKNLHTSSESKWGKNPPRLKSTKLGSKAREQGHISRLELWDDVTVGGLMRHPLDRLIGLGSRRLEESLSVDLEQNKALKVLIPVLRAIRNYHKHKVIGIDNIPRQGPVLVVVNHSLATYDIFILLHAIYEELGRLPRPLADRLFFKIPLLGDLIRFYGAVQGSPDSARRLLRAGELVTVAPGGMREALRPSNQKYKIMWQHRLGFAKLAIETQSTVVLGACPKADDIYDVFPSHLTDWFYKTYRIPIFFAAGWKKTVIPRPIELVHYISRPIMPPSMPKSQALLEKVASEFHAELEERMRELMSQSG